MAQYTSIQRIMDGLYVNYSETAREGDLTALKGCPPASVGQLNCLVFLTNFGGNIYAMSDGGSTAIQEVSNKGQVGCARHLETFIAHQVQQDRLKVKKLKEKSKKDAEKRVKEKSKLLKKLDRDYGKKSAKHRKYDIFDKLPP